MPFDTEFTEQEILNRAFDSANNVLSTQGNGDGDRTLLTEQAIWNRIFDSTNNRVDFLG